MFPFIICRILEKGRSKFELYLHVDPEMVVRREGRSTL